MYHHHGRIIACVMSLSFFFFVHFFFTTYALIPLKFASIFSSSRISMRLHQGSCKDFHVWLIVPKALLFISTPTKPTNKNTSTHNMKSSSSEYHAALSTKYSFSLFGAICVHDVMMMTVLEWVDEWIKWNNALTFIFSTAHCWATSCIYASLSKWKASTLFTIDFDIHSNLTSHPSPARWRDSTNSSQNSQQKNNIYAHFVCNLTCYRAMPKCWLQVHLHFYTWNLKAFPVPFSNKRCVACQVRFHISNSPEKQNHTTQPRQKMISTSSNQICVIKCKLVSNAPFHLRRFLQIFHQISLRKECYANEKPIFLPAQSAQLSVLSWSDKITG